MTEAVDSTDEDHVVLLDDIPVPADDASDPFIVANERRVAIAYRIGESEFDRLGPFAEDDEPFCVVVLSDAAFHQFGPPHDGDLDAHPLALHGLRPYAAHEVLNASLVRDAWGPPSETNRLRHFVFTFQDSTFECVATDCTAAGVYGNDEIARREAFSLCA